MFTIPWDVKEPTHYSKRVGHEVPGVVAVLFESIAGLHQLRAAKKTQPAQSNKRKKRKKENNNSAPKAKILIRFGVRSDPESDPGFVNGQEIIELLL